jgi:hypothetical protein
MVPVVDQVSVGGLAFGDRVRVATPAWTVACARPGSSFSASEKDRVLSVAVSRGCPSERGLLR